MTHHWSERLRALNAYGDLLKWAATQESPLKAWRSCENGDWLLWIASTLGVDRRLIVTAACKCARLALVYVPEGEDRPLKAIEAAERWAAGLVTIEELRCAVDAADDAADAAIAAADRAAVAAADAAFSAAAAAAADAADCAACAAASAAAAAARASRVAADAAAYVNVLRQCSDVVRSVISEDVMLAAWSDKENSP